MRRVVGIVVVVAAVVVVSTVAACSSASPHSQPSPTSSAPLDQMRTFAVDHHASEAWWVRVPLSRAFKLLQGGWYSSSETPNPQTPVYVLVMHGVNGHPQTWGYSVFGTSGTGLFTNTEPSDTKGLTLTPLPLPSPQASAAQRASVA